MSYLIDLHLHTYYSDGSYSKKEVLELAKGKHMKCIAFTDHDTTLSINEGIELGKQYDIEVIGAVELSCKDKDNGRKVHILGYFVEQNSPHIEALCQPLLKQREVQIKQMVNEVNQTLNIPITYEDVLNVATYSKPYKQHFAVALSKYTKQDVYEVLRTYASDIYNSRFPLDYIDVEAAIQAILKDGGIPVLAHPCQYNSFEAVGKYVSYGLKGIECSHPSYKEQSKIDEAYQLAEKYHLITTGGSDDHGSLSMSSKRVIGNYGMSKQQLIKLKEAKICI